MKSQYRINLKKIFVLKICELNEKNNEISLGYSFVQVLVVSI